MWSFADSAHSTFMYGTKDRQVRACVECGMVKTPQWRRGPDGSVSLCNACGLRYIKSNRKRSRKEAAAAAVLAAASGGAMVGTATAASTPGLATDPDDTSGAEDA